MLFCQVSLVALADGFSPWQCTKPERQHLIPSCWWWHRTWARRRPASCSLKASLSTLLPLSSILWVFWRACSEWLVFVGCWIMFIHKFNFEFKFHFIVIPHVRHMENEIHSHDQQYGRIWPTHGSIVWKSLVWCVTIAARYGSSER